MSSSARFVIYRQEVRPFTDKQIELVSELRRAGVIAIENTRLARRIAPAHRRSLESLEQQTATSEVLKVISSSPGELTPVFEAMLRMRLGFAEPSSVSRRFAKATHSA